MTGGSLTGITYEPPVASAQVKSAILLAGIAADGETVVHEPVATRAHTEEMLAAAGADIAFERVGGGRTVRVRRSTLAPGTFWIPGDPSQAAFWVVAGVVVPGSLVTVAGIQLGIERLGFLGVLRRMGATIELEEAGNLTGSVTSYTCALHGTVVEAAEIPSLDEVPILAVAAAAAHGATRFRDVGELRVKESDRLAGHGRTWSGPSGPPPRWRETTWSSRARADRCVRRRSTPGGDHRMAMAAAVAGSACPATAGETTITGWETVATSYPGFARDPRPADRLGVRTPMTGTGVRPPAHHRHRRSGRIGKVHRVPGPGRPAGHRPARHRGHVPGRGLGRSRPRDRPRRPRRGG